MATQESSTLAGRNVFIETCGFLTGTVAGDMGGAINAKPAQDGTGISVLSGIVPADGSELVAAEFTVTSPGTVTTSREMQWEVSDGTNVLATLAASANNAATAAGTILSLIMGTATNGKNLATTDGARLTFTNTEVGTAGGGIHGLFRLVWAL